MRPGFRIRGGFTLLEIMVVLAIGAVLVGLSVPYITGLLREKQMREPVTELQDLAKVMRNRAMTERVPYEIAFTPTGFVGRKSLLYSAETGDTIPDAPPLKIGGEATPPASADASADADANGDADTDADTSASQDGTLAEYRFTPETACRIRFWGSNLWIEPNDVPDCPPWVFAPTGLCNPLRVEFRKGETWIEVAFNPLTADIQEERYHLSD